MSGQFRTIPYAPVTPPAEAPIPETKPTTRLELINPALGICVHLSCQTLDYGGVDFYDKWWAKLGPDPLREDADPERLWTKLKSCKKPIGLVLMDQAMVAGIGNIYRAEVLYKSRLHPEIPANAVTRDKFDQIWKHSVQLLQRGFQSGSILTVDPEDAKKNGAPWTRRYIYNHPTCSCGSSIKSWKMGGRTAYACPKCQPLDKSLVSEEKAKAAEEKDAKVFVSHCAKDGEETLTPEKMTVAMLKSELGKRGIAAKGGKAELLKTLQAALLATLTKTEEVKDEKKPEVAGLVDQEPAAKPSSSSSAIVKPGTLHLFMDGDGEEIYSGDEEEQEDDEGAETLKTPAKKSKGSKSLPFASAGQAAAEKVAAGEKRNVEHIAWIDETELRADGSETGGAGAAKRRRGGRSK